MESSLMGISFKEQLCAAFESASRLRILSPYLTMPAVDFLFKHLPLGVDTQVVVRARPQDVMGGAVDIEALKVLHHSGIQCFLHRTLHGKFYQFDDSHGFIGSANFTANGLCLNGYGNLELSTKVSLSSQDQHLLSSVVEDAIPLTSSILKALTDFAEKQPKPAKQSCPLWWEEIIPHYSYCPEIEGLYVGDLPWCHLVRDNDSVARMHDEDIFALGRSQLEMRNAFIQSKVYSFVLHALRGHEHNQLYFGELSQLLHNGLKDDTLPYRREVKEYVSNLLSYFIQLAPDKVLVDTPNHSQRVFLIE